MILSENMLALLSAQYAHEYSNALFYDALHSWADMRGFDGSAAFLKAQSDGERAHAAKVLAYIGDRNAELAPMVPEIVAAKPATLLELFQSVRTRETDTTDAIYAIRAQAEAEGDAATCAWLMQPDGLIIEQIEEERVSQTILDRWAMRSVGGGVSGEIDHDMDVWIKGMV